VRRLVKAQHPDLARLRVEPFESGWDNAMFRLGDELAVRLPRRAIAVPLIKNEQRWLPDIAKRISVPIPAPVRAGIASDEFPHPWSIVPWFRGVPSNREPLAADQVDPLIEFLRAVHITAPSNAPHNPYRGIPLAQRAPVIEERFTRLKANSNVITGRVLEIWSEALAATPASRMTWLHGDMHARNVLVDRGKLSAVIDWGDICRGDRAGDLACVWILFGERRTREHALEAYGGTESLWQRARGWAISFATVLLELRDDPVHAESGARTLRNLIAGP
jgi:aminoglycoside phosphotransferase (APT) family kinase protein